MMLSWANFSEVGSISLLSQNCVIVIHGDCRCLDKVQKLECQILVGE
jgi:hypothetical protein